MPIVRLADHRLVDRHHVLGRHHRLVSRVRAVGVHVPVSRDLPVVGRLAAREQMACQVRPDYIVFPWYLSLLYY
jgi:hypothetical protein